MIYVLAIIISACLASGQALWGTAVKHITKTDPSVGSFQLIAQVLSSPKFWAGATLYVISTVLYFLLLSKAKFFMVQITMTGVAILMAVLISYFLFHESMSLANFAGILFVIVGIILVTY